MVQKTPPVTKESAKAAQALKALEKKKADDAGKGDVAQKKKKALYDPLRDPNSYTQAELQQMMDNGEMVPNFTAENFRKFVLGEITWAELTGLTMQEAYAFAEVAYNLFEQGKFDEAKTIVEGLVISNPYDGYFHGLLGAIYGRKGMHEEASEEYSIAIELDPTNISALVNRAEIYLQHGEIELALKDLKGAVDLDPKGEKPFGVRARALAAATAAVLEEALKEHNVQAGIAAQANSGAKAQRAPAAKPKPASKR